VVGVVRLGDSFGTAGDLLAAANEWYSQQAVTIPKAFRDCHPLALRRAYKLAGGVWQRVEVCDDGALIVHAEPVWT
jgi:hypothetical protein